MSWICIIVRFKKPDFLNRNVKGIKTDSLKQNLTCEQSLKS